MSVWLELHCDVRREPEAWNEPRCRTFDHEHPMAMAASATSVSLVLKTLSDEARTRGWKRGRDGWECDHCQQLAEIERREASQPLPCLPEGE